jgi:ubiquinone/menaquinone biosynthesis C-methylase UbiE
MALGRDLLETMRSDWNQRAREDAYYYVAFAHPGQATEDFQSTASIILPMLEAEFSRLALAPSACKALEVGCGPGRLMLPMSRHFDEIHGVDVSDEMIARARKLLRDAPNAHPHVGNGADLAMFPDQSFDFVYSYAVFQHIPSKEVVLNYLREIQRVLKPKGVFRGQFYGAIQSATPDTWAGCSFSENEIAEFAAARGLQLSALTGEGTQYLWTTFRKGDRSVPVDVSSVKVLAVTAACGTPAVHQRGALAAVSLWIANLPDESDLNDLTVTFRAGAPLRPCYLSPVDLGGGCQLNVLLPKGIAPGIAPVGLQYRGKNFGGSSIEVLPGQDRVPRLISVTDGVNLLSAFRIECGVFKAVLEDIGEPADVVFEIDGLPATPDDFYCVVPVRDQFYYTVSVPAGVPSGKRALKIRVSGVDLPLVDLEIR